MNDQARPNRARLFSSTGDFVTDGAPSRQHSATSYNKCFRHSVKLTLQAAAITTCTAAAACRSSLTAPDVPAPALTSCWVETDVPARDGSAIVHVRARLTPCPAAAPNGWRFVPAPTSQQVFPRQFTV